MRISDWSSDVCSSDLIGETGAAGLHRGARGFDGCPCFGVRHFQLERQGMILRDPGERHAAHLGYGQPQFGQDGGGFILQCFVYARTPERSAAPTSELQSLMRLQYAVLRLKNKTSSA